MSIWPNECFKGKDILVVGGTSGIGAAVVTAFLEESAKVVSTGATLAEVENAKNETPDADVRLLDVRKNDEIIKIIKSMQSIDHVINCAGVIRRVEEHKPEIFSDVIDINLNGSLRVCHATRGKLAESKGSIVNMASMLTFFGSGVAPAYSSSKGGIGQMTKSLAVAYADDGIRVNAVAPGWIKTPLTKALREDSQKNKSIMDRTALKRWGDPKDVAGGVLYLCSPMASYVTGTILAIDGGYLSV